MGCHLTPSEAVHFLDTCQSGFCPRYSTQTVLIDLVNQQGNSALLILFVLSVAFKQLTTTC